MLYVLNVPSLIVVVFLVTCIVEIVLTLGGKIGN